MHWARVMAANVRDGYGAFRERKLACGCCEMQFFMVCGARQILYVFSLYSNTDLDDRIFDCSLASMAAVQAEDVRASFLFVGRELRSLLSVGSHFDGSGGSKHVC